MEEDENGEEGPEEGPRQAAPPTEPEACMGLGSAFPSALEGPLWVILRHSGEGHDWPTQCGPLL